MNNEANDNNESLLAELMEKVQELSIKIEEMEELCGVLEALRDLEPDELESLRGLLRNADVFEDISHTRAVFGGVD